MAEQASKIRPHRRAEPLDPLVFRSIKSSTALDQPDHRWIHLAPEHIEAITDVS